MDRERLRVLIAAGLIAIGLFAAAMRAYIFAGALIGGGLLSIFHPAFESWVQRTPARIVAGYLLVLVVPAVVGLLALAALVGADSVAHAPRWATCGITLLFVVAFYVGAAFQQRPPQGPTTNPPPRRGAAG